MIYAEEDSAANNLKVLKNDNVEIEIKTLEHELKLKKREALAKLDNAKFGWFHIKACLVSGIGFFTDAYDLFIM